MSKAKTSSTEVKADGSNKKAADTIKVVTVVLLKPTHSMPLLLDGLSLFGPDDFKQHCFIKDLPANLTLEQYMRAVMAAMKRKLPTSIYKNWNQFTVYVEVTKDFGHKVFDFQFPFSLDQSWDTTLQGVYDEAQEIKKNLPTEQRAVEKEKSFSSEEDAQCKDDGIRKDDGSNQEPKSTDQKKTSKVREVSKSTRSDFDEIVGKNLILRVYNY